MMTKIPRGTERILEEASWAVRLSSLCLRTESNPGFLASARHAEHQSFSAGAQFNESGARLAEQADEYADANLAMTLALLSELCVCPSRPSFSPFLGQKLTVRIFRFDHVSNSSRHSIRNTISHLWLAVTKCETERLSMVGLFAIAAIWRLATGNILARGI
jgi:hypothetical protein